MMRFGQWVTLDEARAWNDLDVLVVSRWHVRRLRGWPQSVGETAAAGAGAV